MKAEKKMSETFLTGAILAVAGGFFDAYTYICRGGVFANAQTGNIVLMGIKLASGEIAKGLIYLIPIFSFIAGILICEAVRHNFRRGRVLHWRQITIIFEIAVLTAVAFIPQSRTGNNISNALVSFICSLQVQSFRRVNNNAIATTMCTGNLRSATEHFYNYLESRDKSQLRKSLEYLGIIAFFVIGGAAGAIITTALSVKAALIGIIPLFAAFIIMFI